MRGDKIIVYEENIWRKIRERGKKKKKDWEVCKEYFNEVDNWNEINVMNDWIWGVEIEKNKNRCIGINKKRKGRRYRENNRK